MFKTHNIITAVELGTSKVCVLIGEYSEDGLTVIGKGEAASDGAVVKGEVFSMDLLNEKLIDAIELADIQSNRELNNSSMFSVAVTNCDMDSLLGEGIAFIQNEDRRITEDDVCEAINNAKLQPLNVDRSLVNSFDAYYLLDGVRRSFQPLNQRASTLKACSHIIHGNSNRLGNFTASLSDAGLDYEAEMIFSPVADVFGVLSDDELESGTLLIDFGAGTTEYAVVCNHGMLASGMLAIGFDHVANDISIGLNLPIDFCRQMLENGTLAKLTRENAVQCECRTKSGAVRRIPVDSFNRIADARIREIFEIIRQRLSKEKFWNNLAAGCVLTGGGAEFFRTREIFNQVCDLPARIGKPLESNGCVDLNSPRYSTVYGALQYAYMLALQRDSRRRNSFGSGLRDKISGMGDAFVRTLKSLRSKMTN